MLGIRGRTATIAPLIGTITGGGNTWLLLETVNIAAITTWLYYCVAGTTVAGTIEITPDGVTTWTQAGWIVDEFTNAAGSPIVQAEQNSDAASHSSLTVTLAAFAGTSNAAYGLFSQNEDTAITAGSGFTDLGSTSTAAENANRMKSIWKRGADTTVDVTTATTTADVFGAAVEIAVGDSEGAPFVYINKAQGSHIYYR